MAVKREVPLTSEMKYEGRLINVTFDTAEVLGKTAWREVVHHPGASAVVTVDAQGRLVMERQFRYALQETLLEIPAGKLDKGEDPLVCAQRELEEETGYKAKAWTYLGTIATSPGFCDEVIHLYLARELEMGQTNWDADEYVELEYFTLAELMVALKEERIKDAKSLAAIALALPYLK